ncbi:hypothetical protein NQD34_005068, partial [Periophthalmus magnuspinnatus]
DRGVIAVQAALYGRQDRETCSYGWIMDYPSDTNCFQEGTKEVLQKRCDGRSTCEVPLYVFHLSDPCYGTSKYLESTYACVGHPEIQPVERNIVECEHSTAKLYCGQQKVIHVLWAHYGRTNRNTCSYNRPWSQLSNVHCKNYVTHSVAQKCNGHSSCSVRASNSVFGDPCRGTYKYLEVKYFCRVHRVVCEHSMAHLQCDAGQTIKVLGADFGRRDHVTCAFRRDPALVQKIDCSNPAPVVAEKCDGKNQCEVRVSEMVVEQSCANTSLYLEYSYTCS